MSTEKLAAIRDELIRSMTEYAEGDERAAVHIHRCGQIMDEHLVAIDGASTRDQGLQCVQDTVEKLNKLNEEAGEELIETGERESLCEFIALAGFAQGLNDEDEDVTEEWREW